MTDLEESLAGALIAGIQNGVGETMHPDATALIMIAFKTSSGALRFQNEYIKTRRKLESEGKLKGILNELNTD